MTDIMQQRQKQQQDTEQEQHLHTDGNVKIKKYDTAVRKELGGVIQANFTFMLPCIVTNFLIIKPTRCTTFSNFILEMKLYMFRTVPLSIIRSYSLYTHRRRRHHHHHHHHHHHRLYSPGWALASN
jgi:hypothetical protein